MTCLEFYLEYMQDVADEEYDHMYWKGKFNSNELFDIMKHMATKRRIELTDVDDFDYDTFFFESYKDAEKGLS